MNAPLTIPLCVAAATDEAQRTHISRLACYLDQWGDYPPRLVEAIAATALNRDAELPENLEISEISDMCRRIARRAVLGVLNDPTGGAIRFHHADEWPHWARGLAPCAEIANHLFYSSQKTGEKEAEEQQGGLRC